MLDTNTKRRIDTARDILVGKVPDPKSQVEQITVALIYKFMDDMDMEAVELGGKRTFFSGDYEQYAWNRIFDPQLGGENVLKLYMEALEKLNVNPNVPQLFRDIFKNAYLPYRDPETLKSFLKIIDEFTYDHSERLGDAFEYLLSVLGSQGSAGQFRTPRHIIDFMAEIMAPKKHETILDPACGTAGFLIAAYKHILKHNSSNFDPATDKPVYNEKVASLNELTLNSKKYKGDKLTPDERSQLAKNITGYDISPDMVRLSLVNMYLHGLNDPDISEYDTLTSQDNWNQYADVILANPPFMSPKGGIRPHNRFTITSSRSEVLFVDYMSEHLTPNGRAAIIVPEGIIFQSGTAYKQLRKLLVDEYLVGVISLPAGVFNPYSGVKTSILWLDKVLAKKTDNILFIKIENDGFDLGAQRRLIKQNDLPGSLEAINAYKKAVVEGSQFDSDSFANTLVIEKSKIAENGDYNLSGERYQIKFEISSTFPKSDLQDLCDFNNGLWKGKKEPFTLCKVIRNTNFRKDGFIDWTDIAELEVESRQFEMRELQYGDIILEKSGGGPTQPVGRVVFFNKNEAGFSYSNFTSRIRIKVKSILPEFLLLILRDFYNRGETDRFQKQTSGIRNLDFNLYKQIQIPLPPLSVQEEIVSEIEGYQKIIDGARQVVENYKPQIKIDPAWEVVELGAACEVNPKKSELKDLDENMEVSFVPMADINENQIDFTPVQKKPLGEVIKGYTYFREDDVLLAKVTPCFENGKAGIAKGLENEIGFGSSEYYVFRPNERILSTWIYLNIISNSFRLVGKAKMTGTGGLQRVPKDFVITSFIPLPPIDIQYEIVEQIEKEQSMVNANKQLIEIYEQKIKDRIGEVWGE